MISAPNALMKTAIQKCAYVGIFLICAVMADLSLFAFAARWSGSCDLLTHLPAHYFVTLTIGAAIFAALKQFKLASVFGVVAIINLCFVRPLYLPEARNRTEGRPFRLISV